MRPDEDPARPFGGAGAAPTLVRACQLPTPTPVIARPPRRTVQAVARRNAQWRRQQDHTGAQGWASSDLEAAPLAAQDGEQHLLGLAQRRGQVPDEHAAGRCRAARGVGRRRCDPRARGPARTPPAAPCAGAPRRRGRRRKAHTTSGNAPRGCGGNVRMRHRGLAGRWGHQRSRHCLGRLRGRHISSSRRAAQPARRGTWQRSAGESAARRASGRGDVCAFAARREQGNRRALCRRPGLRRGSQQTVGGGRGAPRRHHRTERLEGRCVDSIIIPAAACGGGEAASSHAGRPLFSPLARARGHQRGSAGGFASCPLGHGAGGHQSGRDDRVASGCGDDAHAGHAPAKEGDEAMTAATAGAVGGPPTRAVAAPCIAPAAQRRAATEEVEVDCIAMCG